MKKKFIVLYVSVILSIASCAEQPAEKAAPQPAQTVQPKAEVSGVLQSQDTPQAHVSGEDAAPSESMEETTSVEQKTEHMSGQ
ncbi:MAG: hypothetical protein ACE5GQ_10580 [Nitrospinales bacterium]